MSSVSSSYSWYNNVDDLPDFLWIKEPENSSTALFNARFQKWAGLLTIPRVCDAQYILSGPVFGCSLQQSSGLKNKFEWGPYSGLMYKIQIDTATHIAWIQALAVYAGLSMP